MARRARQHLLARESVRAAAVVRLRDTKIRFHTADRTDLQADRVFAHPYVQRPDAAARRRQWGSTYYAGRDRLTGSANCHSTIAGKAASGVLNDLTICGSRKFKWALVACRYVQARDGRAQQRPDKRL